jgi:CRP-like cAMP-binding protein/rhodanese-related sulfurtransferase
MDPAIEIKDHLAKSSIFSDIPHERLLQIAHIAEKKSVPADTIIFRQGDPGDSLYLINSGKVRVYRKNPESIETELTILGEGSYFGELALLTGKPRAGNAETIEPTELTVIPKNHFKSILREYPHISSELINQLSQWIVQSDVKLEEERERQERVQRVSIFDYIAVLVLSLVLGIGLNLTNPHGIKIMPLFSSSETFNTIALPAAFEKFNNREAVFIDAMPANFYNKEHIQGALNLPLALFDIMYMLHFSAVEKDREVILYGRTISRRYDEDVAKKLMLNGHQNIKILQNSLSAWKKNGYPTEP